MKRNDDYALAIEELLRAKTRNPGDSGCIRKQDQDRATRLMSAGVQGIGEASHSLVMHRRRPARRCIHFVQDMERLTERGVGDQDLEL